MSRLISESEPIARKEYECMAWPWLYQCMRAEDLDKDDIAKLDGIIQHISNKTIIKKGQKYIKQCLEGDDGLYTFRAIPEIHEICLKYKLYEDN